MRHKISSRKLHRKSGPRKALMQSLAVAFIMHQKIKITEAKAKELRPMVEKMVTGARVKSAHAVREARKILPARAATTLFDAIAPRYKDRKGGYTRIIKLGARKSDGSKMAQIEFV